MLAKIWRALFSAPQVTVVTAHTYDTAPAMAMLSTQEIERRRLYERMAQHQRLIEVEEGAQQRF